MTPPTGGGGWQEQAACQGHPPAVFFDDVERAKAVCATCAVSAECLAYATTNGETTGVWGGVDFTANGEPSEQCGTEQGYHQHRRKLTKVCDPCRQAHNAVSAAQLRQRRGEVERLRAELAELKQAPCPHCGRTP